jgi:hypothetical protein
MIWEETEEAKELTKMGIYIKEKQQVSYNKILHRGY